MSKTSYIFQHHQHSKYFVRFINDNFESKNYCLNVLVPKGANKEPIPGTNTIIFDGVSDEVAKIVRICNESDVVYLVSSFFSPLVKFKLALFHNEIFQKIAWIEWGYDLYNNHSNKFIPKIKIWLKEFVRRFFERKIAVFIAIHPADLPVYDRNIKGKAHKLWAPYNFDKDENHFYEQHNKIALREKLAVGAPLVIQIGNRADEPLNHISILQSLFKYKNENIKIIIPLSYGDNEYAEKVKRVAVDLFAEKVVCLREFMPFAEYQELMSSVDILIVDSDRQIALGNIHPMLYMEKKVYLSSKSPLYKYYIDNGIKVFDIDSLDTTTFEELSKDVDLSSGSKYIRDYKSKDPYAVWSELFSNVESFILKKK